MVKVWHNYSSAKILFDANHYTDTIAVELHYAIEKSLKTFLAYENSKIPRTHDLDELYDLVKEYIEFNDSEKRLISIATEYHIEESYPSLGRSLPPREEIKEVLDFTKILFDRVCNELKINLSKIIDDQNSPDERTFKNKSDDWSLASVARTILKKGIITAP